MTRMVLFFRDVHLARESLRLHDRRVQLHLVGIGTAEVDVLGERQPNRIRTLYELKLLGIVWSEVRSAGEDVAEVASRSVVLIQRRETENQIHSLEDARQ